MKTRYWFLILSWSLSAFAAEPAPPPSAPPKFSAAELEKLAAPIALYPDPLIAVLLPASVYPLEIVQAARFVRNANNLPKLDEQPWNENVKAVAKVPAVITKMDDDISWTMDLGHAFVDQQEELLNTIQSLRAKAQTVGALQTGPQQIVVVTNTVVEKIVEQQVVYVTNQIVQIQPANPEVVYVPAYPPNIYYVPPPPPGPKPPPPLVTFGIGIAAGAIIANNAHPPPPLWHAPPAPGYRPPAPGYHPPGGAPPGAAARPPGGAAPGMAARPPGGAAPSAAARPPGGAPSGAATRPPTAGASRPAPQSAFSPGSGASTRSFSSRGSFSRGGGGFSGGRPPGGRPSGGGRRR
jgi:hypothetical protein